MTPSERAEFVKAVAAMKSRGLIGPARQSKEAIIAELEVRRDARESAIQRGDFKAANDQIWEIRRLEREIGV